MAVLVSYHGNEESQAALATAIEVCRLLHTSLEIIVAAKTDEDDEHTQDDAHERLWKALASLDQVPFHVRSARSDVTIAQEILSVANQIEADLIVLGLRIGGSRVTTIGTNASHVMLDAPCPVITTTEFVLTKGSPEQK